MLRRDGFTLQILGEARPLRNDETQGNLTKLLPSLCGAQIVSSIEPYVIQNESKPALWLLVDRVEIGLGSALLKDRINLIDLPGKEKA
jgi:uncharacterized protein (DUF1499 family)